MKALISQRIVKPRNCAIAFGIPTSEAAFFEALQNPEGRDFVPNCLPVWAKYYLEIVVHFEGVRPAFEGLGVTVATDVSLVNFGTLLKRSDIDVIILFSHWGEDQVEFADSLHAISEVMEQIPQTFSGFLDLCVCHPEKLAIEMRKNRQEALTRYIPVRATPYIWLYFYLTVLKLLEGKNMTYMEALDEARELALRDGHGKG
jgi:hypothetical protein